MRQLALLVALLVVTMGAPLAGQAPEREDAQAPPVFEAGVDVVAVDVSVVDEESRPLVGLGREDFRVEVDGQDRRLLSVEYMGREVVPPAPPAARPAHFSSNEYVEPGRLVLFLVDMGNIARGSGRDVFDSVGRFISNLPPADLVGLAVVPGGPTIGFTSERDEIREAMRSLIGEGRADRGAFRVPMTEAVSYVVNQDRVRWTTYVEAECARGRTEVRARRTLPAEVDQCRAELEAQAHQVVAHYRERSLQSRRAFLQVLRFLQGIEGSKAVVLISEGLWTEIPSEVTQIADAVAEAQVTLYVLLLEKPEIEFQFERGYHPTLQKLDFETASLYDLASLSGGTILPVVGDADALFARLDRELTGHYLLGFEPEPGDRDGGRHSVRVEVARPNVVVRARTHLNIPAAPPSREELIVGVLRSPRLDRGLAVRVASYAMRAPAADKVRLLIAAQVARPRRPLGVGYTVSFPGGQVVASGVYPDVPGGDGEWAEFVGEAVVDPGTYLVRLAAVDATARRGSVDHTAKAALVSAGGLEISDLVLWGEEEESAVRPAVDLELEGEGMQALVEIGGRDASRLAGATVALELADFADGPALVRVPVHVPEAGADGGRVARVGVVGGLLPPGEYTARAEISVNGRPVAVVTRPYHVVLPPPGGRTSRLPLASVLVEARPFDRTELLEAAPLVHFVDRVSALVQGEAPKEVKAAIAEARQGRPEAMLDRLGDGAPNDARADFLRGVSHYARGDWGASLAALRSALGRNSELFPAAVYMGACHAAVGRDPDAIGAWQTALIGETGSPTLYALLGAALLRVKEADQAVSILAEGVAAFPDDESLRRRLALAHAVAGQRDEALPLLTALVDEHPDDAEALLATLALLFEGFARTTAGDAAPAETEQLVRYARAYVEGQGPNREVVERWLRYLETHAGG